MTERDPVNILLVDDQPAKLLAYEVILKELGENLITVSSGEKALDFLLRNEVALILVDVCMPGLDGFQLAAMIREHPRFQRTAIIFISAIQVTDLDRLRGYEMGAVDYVPVPVVPEVLRAKVRVFAELFRKTRALERLNIELEERVKARTADLEASHKLLVESEKRRTLALTAGKMGSWDWDWKTGDWMWDEGHYQIFGVDPDTFKVSPSSVQKMLHSDDMDQLQKAIDAFASGKQAYEAEFRIRQPSGNVRWCFGTGAAQHDEAGQVKRISGVTIDITERKEAERRQTLLAREVDHRAKNALALVQSMVRLTRAESIKSYAAAVEGRIMALARIHTVLASSRWQGAELFRLIEEELAPYRMGDGRQIRMSGPQVMLPPAAAQTVALAIHELATNAVKYGALSIATGSLGIVWVVKKDGIELVWEESNGPAVQKPKTSGFGTKSVIVSVESQLGGKVDFNWRAQGLSCTLQFPIVDQPIVREEPSAPARRDVNWPQVISGGARVLVVEDEALVALGMCELLSELGYSVVGPFGKTSDALPVVKASGADLAILDINLGGELAYSLADALLSKEVPFLFVTGYSADAIEERFRGVTVLQKPVGRDSLSHALSPLCNRALGESHQAP